MLKDFWYIFCLASELKTKPVARTIVGEHLVVFRDKEGNLGALEDRCIHRNLALSRGKVTKHGLQCAYHGFTYATTGKCAFVPAQPRPTENTKAKVRAFRVVEQQGFIWVFMGDAQKLKTDNLPLQLPMYDDKKARRWVMQRVFAGNAFHCAENFLDVPHTVFVHNKWFRSEIKDEIDIEVRAGKDWVEAEFLGEQAFDSLVGKLLLPKNEKMVHTDKFMLPYTTRVDYFFSERRHFIVMSQCSPINENSTRVFTYMAFRFDGFASLIKLLYRPLANRILDQDVDLIAEQTQDIQKFNDTKFLYHKTDAIGKEIADLIAGKKITKGPIRKRLRV